MSKPFILLLLSLLAIGCIQSPQAQKTTVQISVSGSNFTPNATIADTPASRTQGLMGVSSLAPEEGMLFIYETQGYLSFWMANTQIPLDILFLDENKKIVDIQAMNPCTQIYGKDCPRYISKKPAKYAIELNQNLSKTHNLQIGQTVYFD